MNQRTVLSTYRARLEQSIAESGHRIGPCIRSALQDEPVLATRVPNLDHEGPPWWGVVSDFTSAIEDIRRDFRRLMESEPFRIDERPSPVPKKAGVYVLYEGDRAVYVGRGRDLRQRLGNQRSSSPSAALPGDEARRRVGRFR